MGAGRVSDEGVISFFDPTNADDVLLPEDVDPLERETHYLRAAAELVARLFAELQFNRNDDAVLDHGLERARAIIGSMGSQLEFLAWDFELRHSPPSHDNMLKRSTIGGWMACPARVIGGGNAVGCLSCSDYEACCPLVIE